MTAISGKKNKSIMGGTFIGSPHLPAEKRLIELGIEARASTPQEISARLKSDIDKWQKVIEKAGIQKQ